MDASDCTIPIDNCNWEEHLPYFSQKWYSFTQFYKIKRYLSVLIFTTVLIYDSWEVIIHIKTFSIGDL